MTSDAPLTAHSLAESFLHIMAQYCGACGEGSLLAGDATVIESHGEDACTVSIPATCRKCGHESSRSYFLENGLGLANDDHPPIVNPGDRPSRILDVAQWIMLFRMIISKAAQSENKQESRQLGLEAAMCLDEALKFFDDPDSDLPPAEAFSHESSRARFRDHPEFFSRQRLIDLRAKLPSETAMRRMLGKTGDSRQQKRRWRFWKK